jgi:hypothetical protein
MKYLIYKHYPYEDPREPVEYRYLLYVYRKLDGVNKHEYWNTKFWVDSKWYPVDHQVTYKFDTLEETVELLQELREMMTPEQAEAQDKINAGLIRALHDKQIEKMLRG